AGPVMIACAVCFHPRANGIGAIEYPCGNVQFVGCCHRYVETKDAAAEIEAQSQGAVVSRFAGAAKNDALRPIIFVHQLPAIPGREKIILRNGDRAESWALLAKSSQQ